MEFILLRYKHLHVNGMFLNFRILLLLLLEATAY